MLSLATHKVVNENIDFRTFALLSLRRMTALVDYRDTPANTIITEIMPREIEDSLSCLELAKARLAEVQAMTPEEQQAYGAQLRDQSIRSSQETLEYRRATNAKLTPMLIEVMGWQPPTPDHERFKQLMRDDLLESFCDVSRAEQTLAEATAATPETYWSEFLKDCERDVVREQSNLKESKTSIEDAQAWVDAVVNSLPQPSNVAVS